jgi:hypothetical protein
MTPATAIAALDRQLEAHGSTLVLRRYVAGSDAFADHTLKGFVRGLKPQPLVGDVSPNDSTFILSPSSFPDGWSAGERWPVKGDFLFAGGRERKIEAIERIEMGDTVVRFDGRIVG